MNLSLIEKLEMLYEYLFSSFLSIEMFILSLLLFLILILNLKRNNPIISMVSIGIYMGFVIGILISYRTYVSASVHSLFKWLLNYIYFPSTIVYFFIILFVSVMVLWTLFSKKLSNFKKGVNYLFFSVLYFFFMSFVALASYDMVDLLDMPTLYENDLILTIVQLSNFILLVWSVFTGFYWLYRYFKKKYD